MAVRKRLLVTISFSFSIRYIIRTGMLKKLKEFCEPVIAIAWNEEGVINELRSEGFEVHIIPASEREPSYNDVRKKIDAWFNHFCLKSPSQKIQDDYLRQYVSMNARIFYSIKKWRTVLQLYAPFYKKKLFAAEKQLLYDATNYAEICRFADALQIDAVFTVTPFHKQEDLLLRACKNSGKKMITSILSFDNITKRGWIPFDYDIYMMWNMQNKQQLERIYPYAKNTLMHVTGAPQFDFYFNDAWLLSKKEWKKMMGLPDEECKIILYAGGPEALFPNETQYLRHLNEAINNGEIKFQAVILFRCHPIDHVNRWKKAIGNSSNIIFDESWTGKNDIHHADITDNDIRKLCSTLAYTDVHVNLCSTMTVDGSAFDKPQTGPAYDEINPHKQHLLQVMYRQEHFLPIIETGGLAIATSRKEFIKEINKSLENPELFSENRKEILKKIITHADNKSTGRVVSVIRRALNHA